MPVTRYARSGDVSIAYQVVGDGPVDLVYVPGWISNIEVMWEEPAMAFFLRGLASFSRLILFDKRGTGLSDPVPLDRIPGLEERMDDVRAVMDDIGSERAFLLGHSEGGNMCTLFAASHPERTAGLVLVSTYAKRVWSEDYPWAPTPGERLADIAEIERHFGDPEHLPDWIAPSRMGDPAFKEWVAKYFRMGSSPRAAAHLLRMNTEMDTTAVLPTISVPTLCIYRCDDQDVKIEEGRWIASRIPDAKLVELPGADHLLNGADVGTLVAEIEEFVTGSRTERDVGRVLATVMITDIVGSTGLAVEMGDSAWADLLQRYRAMVTAEVLRHRGTLIDATGDEAAATFDGPARAVRAALSIRRAAEVLGIEVRSGLHTGEIQLTGTGIAGLAVHIAARVSAMASAGEVIVSRTVKDLTVGSGLTFQARGVHTLKGVPDEWQIYAVDG